jgi:hypothetical protein
MGALVPEENAFNLIMLLSDPGTLGNHPEVGFRIFGSYAYEKVGVSRRGGTGLIQFNGTDNDWAWYDDWRAGPIHGYFVIDNPDRDTPIGSIGVARVDVPSLEALRPLFAEFRETVVGSEFDVTLPVGKAMVTGRGLVTRSETRLISAYYFLTVAGNNHLVMVDHDEGATDRDPATLHEWPVFTEAMTRTSRSERGSTTGTATGRACDAARSPPPVAPRRLSCARCRRTPSASRRSRPPPGGPRACFGSRCSPSGPPAAARRVAGRPARTRRRGRRRHRRPRPPPAWRPCRPGAGGAPIPYGPPRSRGSIAARTSCTRRARGASRSSPTAAPRPCT